MDVIGRLVVVLMGLGVIGITVISFIFVIIQCLRRGLVQLTDWADWRVKIADMTVLCLAYLLMIYDSMVDILHGKCS